VQGEDVRKAREYSSVNHARITIIHSTQHLPKDKEKLTPDPVISSHQGAMGGAEKSEADPPGAVWRSDEAM
jgi:hypothetical protein